MVAPQKRQTFNNGTEGASITATTSATSGDAIGTPIVAGTGAGVFAAAAAIRGARGAHVSGVAATSDTYSMFLTGTANGSASGQIYFKVDSANPPAAAGWVVCRFRSASANVAIVSLSTARILQIQNSAGTTLKNFNTNTALSNGWYVINVQATKGTGTGDGFIAAQLYTESNTTTAVDTYTASNVNAGTADITQWQFGKVTAGGDIDAYIDEPAFSTGTVTALDFVSANVPPTVDAGVNQDVAAAATVNLSATAADTDGTVSSYAWTYDFPASGGPTLTGGTTATPNFTAGSAGALYVLRCTVTDNLGSTAADTVEVRVPRAGSATSRTLAVAGTGDSWTNTGGSATDGQALSDESDSTYLQSATLTGTATTRRVRLDPSFPRATSNLKLKLWTDTGTGNTTVKLIEGSTTRQTWTQAVTATITEYTFALSSGTISAIGDWGNLYVEVGATT